ncbi:MAG: SDR family oxidoreductase [Actinobacteria bacterium]|nr:SDR family oxidoreductase [Actinomycetota bacterium]
MDLGLEGKTAVVTGATRGIGLAIAEAMAAEGASLVICARDAEAVEAVAAQLRERHRVEVTGVRCDVAKSEELESLVATAKQAHGAIHILVNNPSAGAEDDEDGSWEASFEVDLLSAVRASRLIADLMPEGSGAIVHIASTSGLEADGGPASYAAMKAALIAHARSLAEELGPRGIRVNSVAPGAVEFEDGYWAGIRESDPDLHAEVVGLSALGRLGEPAEIASAVAFLASDRASYITGAMLRVDGGQSKTFR